MARPTVVLQSMFTADSNQAQDSRFAVRIPGGAKSALCLINVMAGPSVGTADIRIYTATDLLINPQLVASGAGIFWASLGVASAIAATTAGAGVKVVTLTPVGEYVRWATEGMTGSGLRFSVTIYPFDA